MLSFAIGPFALAVSHILLMAALALAILVGGFSARSSGKNPESTLFGLFLLGLLGARAGFVFSYWAQYRDAPWHALLDIRDGGFLVWVGVVVVLLGGLWRGWQQASLRRPLAMGMGSGLLLWSVLSLGISLYQKEARLPLITLRNELGDVVQLADYKGRPLVINLWATWCPPCRREMPVLQAAQAQHREVVFLFVNQMEDPQTVSNFLSSQGLQLNNLLFDASADLAREVGSRALPTTLFYSPEGQLVGNHLGELSAASLSHWLQAIAPQTAP